MRVLVACEESQTVAKAFRAQGHEAYSCDIQHCALYDHLEWHIVEDARAIINGNCEFLTVDGKRHRIDGPWDMLIAHPPCTFLTSSSAVRLFNADHTIKDRARLEKGWAAKQFFLDCLGANAKKSASKTRRHFPASAFRRTARSLNRGCLVSRGANAPAYGSAGWIR